MSKSAKAKVDDLLSMAFHQLHEKKIRNIHATMEAVAYGVEKASTTKCWPFQVRLHRACQVATTWLDADLQKAIERLEREIHQVTPVKRNIFDTLFQSHEQQQLQEVRTKATSSRSKFAKQFTLLKTAAETDAYRVANITCRQQTAISGLPIQC
jgi:hypothetical protein